MRRPRLRRHTPASIVRLVPVRDEADILEPNLRWYADASISTVVFDNGSGDATRAIVEAGVEAGTVAAHERAEQPVAWKTVGTTLLALAARFEPDLVLVAAADEFVETADGSPLREAIEADLRAGHDVLRFETMEFCLTEDDDPALSDPIRRMRRYSPFPAVLRDRGLRWACGITWPVAKRLTAKRSPGGQSPRRYVSRHYPLRSPEQARDKARSKRLRPVLAGSSAAALEPLVTSADDLVLPARKLHRYDDDHRWSSLPVVAPLRLAAAAQLMRRAEDESRRVRRSLNEAERAKASLTRELASHKKSLARLRKRYGETLLEREQLAAAGGPPTGEALAASSNWYDEHYRLTPEAYDVPYHESVYLPIWECIAERLEDSASVLEIGCGSGQLASLLIDRGLRDYVGFDFSPVAIELARKRLPQANLQVADARTTSLLEETTYDVALATEVLEHLDDDLALLGRVRAGVRVIATVPNFDSTSHLRHFTDETAVCERYGAVLREVAVSSVPLNRGSRIFLVEGVAKGCAAQQ